MGKGNGRNQERIFVGSIFGKESGEGLVTLEWSEKKTQLSIEEARKVAFDLLECAEAAESDAMCYQFGMDAGDALVGLALIKFMRRSREQRRSEHPRQ